MTDITIGDLVAHRDRFAAMIAAFQEQTQAARQRHLTVPGIEIELQPGEHYAGAVLDESGQVMHHLVLMAEKPEGRLDWDNAVAWATSVGGTLPTRQEQALLFANCKPHLEAAWHWSGEQHAENASFAWLCHFHGGNQFSLRKSYEGCGRAVRRIR